MTVFHAEELTSEELAGFVTEATVGVLPVAAIEPHGPHLPLSTDCDIARGHLSHLPGYLPDDVDVLVLPLQMVGHSIEHTGSAGVFTHRPEILLQVWADIVAPFRALGGRRLIVVSSHGGNSELVSLLNQRLAVDHAMLAISAAWLRLGQPEGVFELAELAYGIHGGDVETSLMLHYWPDAVRLDSRADFPSAAAEWEHEGGHLTAHGRTRMAWLTTDLNPAGALGNALAASAEKGAASADHALHGFAELVLEAAHFDLARLRGGKRP